MTLSLQGDPADITSFLDMLSGCSGINVYVGADGNVARAAGPPTSQKAPFMDALDCLLSSPNHLTILVGRSQRPTIYMDSYCPREIDLDDLEQLPTTPPAGSPNQLTRCENLIHILAEYCHALNNGHTHCMGGYGGENGAHQEGLDAQDRHREANGQEGGCHSIEQDPADPHRIIYSYCNGSKTIVTIDNECNVTGIEHQEAEEEGGGDGGRCFIATAAYGTPLAEEIQDLRAWRDNYLRKNWLGRAFINVYYRISPPIARLVSMSETAKAGIRTLLRPIIWMIRKKMTRRR